MILDTTSRLGMENSLAYMLNTSVRELYQYIGAAADFAEKNQMCFNLDLFEKAMEDFYSDMIDLEWPDEMLFFHLSRRLKGTENETSYNLQKLLTSNNKFSEFLNMHQITFSKGEGNRLILSFRGRPISLKNTMDIEVCYLRGRLGYNTRQEDFCFNGFAFRDLLMKNDYTRQLQYSPEILEVLERYLQVEELTNNYYEQSQYHCFCYKFPIERIIFDGKEELSIEEKRIYLLNQVAFRLCQYSGDPQSLSDDDNPIIRLSDHDNADPDCLVFSEIITADMMGY